MKSLTLLPIVIFLTSVTYAQQPAQFVSSKVSTAYNSQCTTLSGSTTVSPVPTITTTTIRYPDLTISSTNTFTPSGNVFVTTTPVLTISSTTTLPTVTSTVISGQAPLRREIANEGIYVRNIRGNNKNEQKINNTSAYTDEEQRRSDYIPRKRAVYPNQVKCAARTIAVTTSFFTETAASRTVTRTTTLTTTTTSTVTPTATVTVSGYGTLTQGSAPVYEYVDYTGTHIDIENRGQVGQFFFDKNSGHLIDVTIPSTPKTAGASQRGSYVQFDSNLSAHGWSPLICSDPTTNSGVLSCSLQGYTGDYGFYTCPYQTAMYFRTSGDNSNYGCVLKPITFVFST
jgi:hypothetical protein